MTAGAAFSRTDMAATIRLSPILPASTLTRRRQGSSISCSAVRPYLTLSSFPSHILILLYG